MPKQPAAIETPAPAQEIPAAPSPPPAVTTVTETPPAAASQGPADDVRQALEHAQRDPAAFNAAQERLAAAEQAADAEAVPAGMVALRLLVKATQAEWLAEAAAREKLSVSAKIQQLVGQARATDQFRISGASGLKGAAP